MQELTDHTLYQHKGCGSNVGMSACCSQLKNRSDLQQCIGSWGGKGVTKNLLDSDRLSQCKARSDWQNRAKLAQGERR